VPAWKKWALNGPAASYTGATDNLGPAELLVQKISVEVEQTVRSTGLAILVGAGMGLITWVLVCLCWLPKHS
jgi:hypothetical protein